MLVTERFLDAKTTKWIKTFRFDWTNSILKKSKFFSRELIASYNAHNRVKIQCRTNEVAYQHFWLQLIQWFDE